MSGYIEKVIVSAGVWPQFYVQWRSDIARLGHTGACPLATRGRAPPVQARNRIICADSIIVDRKSGTTLTLRKFAVSHFRYNLRTDLGCYKIFWGRSPQTPLNASALCAQVRTHVRTVLMLCPSIDGVLATSLFYV